MKVIIQKSQINGKIKAPASKAKGAVIDSRDHGIAMAFGILGLVGDEKTIIKKAECVSKSFPEFWKHLIHLKADIKIK